MYLHLFSRCIVRGRNRSDLGVLHHTGWIRRPCVAELREGALPMRTAAQRAFPADATAALQMIEPVAQLLAKRMFENLFE